MRKKEILLVYQMGKVGSDSIVKNLSVKALHLHTLYGCNPNSKYLNASHSIRTKINKYFYFWNLRRKIRAYSKIKIITCFRPLSERDPSMFFHDLDGYIHKYRTESSKNYFEFNSGGVEILKDLYYQKYDFEYGLNWIGNELSRFTGIRFLEKNKARFYSTRNYEVLVLNTNEIDSCGELIAEFSGGVFTLGRSNASSEKWHAPIYDEFKKDLNYEYKSSNIACWIESKVQGN
ncbi:putative capsular polysaccharide synthesis family protein [Porticoccaceae bacterium]|nr:putative capsular polysaccharide synthesis family protein [Porticoccaceae bacterium]